MIKEIDLSSFVGREEALNGIKRFYDIRWDVMFYRTTVGFHVQRVLWILDDILERAKQVYGLELDVSFARTLALVHDDAEIVTGDVQLYKKEHMNAEQKAAHEASESRAIEELRARFPTFANGYLYDCLLDAARDKDCLEAQLVSYCDKLDGMCEATHEVIAGNVRFIGPAEHYARKKIPKLLEEFPELKLLIPGSLPFLQLLKNIDGKVLLGKPYTAESVLQPTGIPHYERWKELTIQHAGIDALIAQKEYEENDKKE